MKLPATALDTATHVLEWLPPWLFESNDDCQSWELQTLADHQAGTPQPTWDCLYCPEDADPARLAKWVEGQVGYPVTLTPDVRKIKRRRVGRWHTVPIYYVSRRP